MSTVLKSIGVIGAGAVIAMGIASSGPSPTNAVESPEVQPALQLNAAAAVAAPKPTVSAPAPVSNCHPSYSGCLKMNAGDYDCASGSGNGPNYTGRVQVYGSDPFDLDRDGDGVGCER